jgi:hypothetical protein
MRSWGCAFLLVVICLEGALSPPTFLNEQVDEALGQKERAVSLRIFFVNEARLRLLAPTAINLSYPFD